MAGKGWVVWCGAVGADEQAPTAGSTASTAYPAVLHGSSSSGTLLRLAGRPPSRPVWQRSKQRLQPSPAAPSSGRYYHAVWMLTELTILSMSEKPHRCIASGSTIMLSRV